MAKVAALLCIPLLLWLSDAVHIRIHEKQEPDAWTTCMSYYQPSETQAFLVQQSDVCKSSKTILEGLQDPIGCLTHQLPGVFAKMCQMCSYSVDGRLVPPAEQSTSKCALRYKVLDRVNASLLEHDQHVITELRMAQALIPSLMRAYPTADAAVSSGTAAIALATAQPWVDADGDGVMSDVEVRVFLKTIFAMTDMAQNTMILDGYTPEQMEMWNGPEWTTKGGDCGDFKCDWLGFEQADDPASLSATGASLQPIITIETVQDTTHHGCGAPHTLADGTQIFDMPPSSPSTCKATYALVDKFLADLKQGSLTENQLSDMIMTVDTLSKAGTSFTDLWNVMPKTSSGEVEVSIFNTMFHTTQMDVDHSGSVSWHEAGNYNHAILEIGGEGSVFDPNEVCGWAACA